MAVPAKVFLFRLVALMWRRAANRSDWSVLVRFDAARAQDRLHPACERPRRPRVGGTMTDGLKRAIPLRFATSAVAARPSGPGSDGGRREEGPRPRF